MKTKPKLPRTINLTITEADRQNAENFGDDCNCLIATALKRRGFEDVHEWVNCSQISRREYSHEFINGDKVHRDYFASSKPFYLPSVVGLKIKLTRVDPL